MPFYQKAAAEGRLRRRHARGARSDPREPVRSSSGIEREPATAKPGTTYRVADMDLASRMSFFLWGTPPDKELHRRRQPGKLSDPITLEQQTKRMLADPRAEALATRFAAQWLRLQDIDKVHPDPNFYPNFDDNLAGDDARRRPSCSSASLVREDRSLLDLYRADYTFLNERLAQHYGIPGVAGDAVPQGRRIPTTSRRGMLGQGSMLVQTSLANRTSPVLRGKWVMEVLLGTPPPPPPPDVPDLEAAGEAKEGRVMTTRERMEMHRKNPTCNSCHRFMDPIGLALDNFDVTGEVAGPRERQPARHQGRFLRRHADHLARRARGGADEAADAAGAHVHREPDGLRARPPRRVLRPAGDPRHRAQGRGGQYGCRRSSWASSRATPFRMKRVERCSRDRRDQGRRAVSGQIRSPRAMRGAVG